MTGREVIYLSFICHLIWKERSSSPCCRW